VVIAKTKKKQDYSFSFLALVAIIAILAIVVIFMIVVSKERDYQPADPEIQQAMYMDELYESGDSLIEQESRVGEAKATGYYQGAG